MSPARWTIAALLGMPVLAVAFPVAQVFNTNQTREVVFMPSNGPMGNWAVGISSDSLAMNPAGKLFIADPVGALWEISGPPIPLGPTGKMQIADLDWAPGGLWGYSNASQELFFYNLGSSSVTISAAIALPGGLTVTGVAHQASSGDLYLSARNGLNNDSLWKVPASLSGAAFVGVMAHADAFSYIADIDFDAGGQLYAMTWFHRDFYTVNLSTAATGFISNGPHRDATAMALMPVPEAPTAAMFGAGLLAFSMARRWAAGRRPASRAAGEGSAPRPG